MPSRRPTVTLIGAGRLAGSLVPALLRAHYPIASVASPGGLSAEKLVARYPGPVVSDVADPVTDSTELLLLAVPDREISPLACRLADRSDDWEGRTVLHHAGALGLMPLVPLQRRGAAIGLLHPFQCLGRDAATLNLLAGSWARIEGCFRGRKIAEQLAHDLELHLLPLAELDADQRVGYHAAAALASNDLVAVLALARDLLIGLGLDSEVADQAIAAIAGGTTRQLAHGGVASALTGPVVRGDAAVVREHLRVLGLQNADHAAIHRGLARRLLELAQQHDPAARSRLQEIERLLKDGG